MSNASAPGKPVCAVVGVGPGNGAAFETTRKRMPDKPDSFFIKPADVADTAFWLTRQPPSAWSFEVEARPFGETW